MRTIKRAVAVLPLFLSLCGCAGLEPTAASQATKLTLVEGAASLKTGEAPPPPGFVAFCQRYPGQCEADAAAPRRIALTPDMLQVMRLVNVAMNRSIRPEEDRAHYGLDEYWTIPLDGYGDCDEYVLVKRKALLDLGFPEPSLRIAEVFAPRFVRHVVLIVSTDKGNYVLDNLKDDVATWDRAAYGWVKWQDPQSSSGWMSLE
jgi:predicted transglutaminase-like cysteine proteinase